MFQCKVLRVQCVNVCLRCSLVYNIRVSVCLHIYRYIGTYIDRSKIAHASAHTSIYMHRNIIMISFFILSSHSIISLLTTIIVHFTCKKTKVFLSQWDSIHFVPSITQISCTDNILLFFLQHPPVSLPYTPTRISLTLSLTFSVYRPPSPMFEHLLETCPNPRPHENTFHPLNVN